MVNREIVKKRVYTPTQLELMYQLRWFRKKKLLQMNGLSRGANYVLINQELWEELNKRLMEKV